jgi:putative membrane protein
MSACFPAHFIVHGGALTLAGAATVLWIANLAIRPIFQLIALPITIITLGFFSLVVNAGMVSLTDLLIPAIHIHGFGIRLLTAILIAFANSFLVPKTKRAIKNK